MRPPGIRSVADEEVLLVEDSAVVGCVGQVLLRIRGGEEPGEVAVRVRGTVETLIAYADAAIDRGATVLVVTSRGNRSVDVIPWEE